MDKDQQYDALKNEVIRLFEAVQKIKSEIASIKHPKSEMDHFDTVADQLQAIVDNTESATNEIMESTEGILAGVRSAETASDNDTLQTALGEVVMSTNRIFEACSFQDITGQRISKIIKTMNLIEGTLNSLVVIVGEQALAALPTDVVKEVESNDKEGEPLHGPALEGEGISQADIDKLFD